MLPRTQSCTAYVGHIGKLINLGRIGSIGAILKAGKTPAGKTPARASNGSSSSAYAQVALGVLLMGCVVLVRSAWRRHARRQAGRDGLYTFGAPPSGDPAATAEAQVEIIT